MKVSRVTNLVRALEDLKSRDIWVIGAEASGEGNWFDADYTRPVAIVLGSEGRGLRPLVKKTCDTVLSIPLSGQVNSLNVSAAAAVFMFEVVRQRRARRIPD
jgi:rRNA methylases